jgi:DinB family protein
MAMSASDRSRRIDQYALGPERLRQALNRVPDGMVKWRPAPGKWSVHEIVCHAADSEVNGYARLRFLVAEKEPLVVGYDQDGWARTFDYHALPLEPSLAVVEAVRGSTAVLLQRLDGEAWTRKGRHTEKQGDYTVEDWLKIYSDHLEGHARQIDRNVDAWQKAGGRPSADASA